MIDRKTIEISFSSLLLFIIISIYAFSTYQRNLRWTDEYTLWNDALMKSPSKSRPYIYTGIAYAKDKRFKEAYTSLSMASVLNPEDIEAKYNLSILYMDLNRYDLAENGFKSAIKMRPDLKESFIALSGLYSKQNRFREAGEILKQAYARWPDDTGIGLKLATANAQSGNIEAAEIGYKQILTRQPKNIEALGGLGNIYMIGNRPIDALRLYEMAIALNPDEPEPIYNAALVLDGLEENEKAIQYYELFILAAEASGQSYSGAIITARERIIRLKFTSP